MKKLKLTKEEKELFKGNQEGLRQAFLNKAALAEAEKCKANIIRSHTSSGTALNEILDTVMPAMA